MKFEHVKDVQKMHEGNSLKSHRKKLGLAQQDIANKIWISQSCVSSIEKSRAPYGYYGRRYREVLAEQQIILLGELIDQYFEETLKVVAERLSSLFATMWRSGVEAPRLW